MLSELLLFVRIFRTPRSWVRNRCTNWEWDREIRRQLKAPKFTNVGRYDCSLGSLSFWTENYPYEYGYDTTGVIKGMPSRRTVFLLMDALTKHQIGEKNDSKTR